MISRGELITAAMELVEGTILGFYTVRQLVAGTRNRMPCYLYIVRET